MGWLDEKGFGRKMRNESAFEAIKNDIMKVQCDQGEIMLEI